MEGEHALEPPTEVTVPAANGAARLAANGDALTSFRTPLGLALAAAARFAAGAGVSAGATMLGRRLAIDAGSVAAALAGGAA
jgi:hypothetical protein